MWHEKRNAYGVVVGKPDGNRPVGKPRVGGRIILRCIVETWDGL
jgi:hypothetical protein